MSAPARVDTQDDPKRLALIREIEDPASRELEAWQEHFAKWLSMNSYAKLTQQTDVATTLAGFSVSREDLKRLKQRKAWKDKWYVLRNLDNDINEARVRFGKHLGKAADVYGASLDALKKELRTGDSMGAARAAAPLVIPALDRAIPKNPEQIIAPVVIQLTPHQVAALNQPEHIVTAEEVVVETDQ